MLCPHIDFCSGNIYIALSFQVKKNENSEKFFHVGFCAPKMSIIFWQDFAAVIISILTPNRF